MRNRRDSTLFEQRVHRIHELLEGSGAQVTWNDRVADPDNPKQPRQIDVTIKRAQHLTLIECRLHQAAQNVKWIEELIGRRRSLSAHSVIAVSASGFTKGAQRKAVAHGIALRDLRRLTDAEVAGWSQSVGITLICYQYSAVELTLWVDDPTCLDLNQMRDEFPRHPITLTLFNQANRFLTDNQMMTANRAAHHPRFGITLEGELGADVVLGGAVVRRIEMNGRAEVVRLPVDCPRIEAYGSPVAAQDDAVVQRFALGETSIVHDRNRIAVLLDISTIDLPRLCQFVGFETTTGGLERDYEALELIGVEKLREVRGAINISVRSLRDRTPHHEARLDPGVQ